MRAIAGLKLATQPGKMKLDRTLGDEQLSRDLEVRKTVRDEFEYF